MLNVSGIEECRNLYWTEVDKLEKNTIKAVDQNLISIMKTTMNIVELLGLSDFNLISPHHMSK